MWSRFSAVATFSILAALLALAPRASAEEPKADSPAQISWKNFSFNGSLPWLISRDGRLVMSRETDAPEDGCTEATIVFMETDTGAVVKSIDIGEVPVDAEDQDARKNIREVNKFLMQHAFMASGEAAGDLTTATCFEKESIEVVHGGKAYTGGYGSQRLENTECCRWTTLQGDRYFPKADVILATIQSECTGLDATENPCDCDGDYPDGDEEEFTRTAVFIG